MVARPRRKAVESEPPAKHEVIPTRPLESVAGDAAGTVPTLDGIIHERARLAIVTALASGDARSHTELRDLLRLSDGNLSVHARKLEDAGYVHCTKEFSGRTPRTTYRLTPAGRRAFERYLSHLEHLVNAMKGR
ncbi:MAG: transcriptional regulator [Gemmatimonadaceae bacterium]|nr:transcriptional regulator [Gemmatimonadaceae bacterium]